LLTNHHSVANQRDIERLETRTKEMRHAVVVETPQGIFVDSARIHSSNKKRVKAARCTPASPADAKLNNQAETGRGKKS
jgi:hypothetical protein